MITNEIEFERELKVFQDEINEATESFYIWLTVHRLARRNRRLVRILNENAAFWNLTLRALQANSVIALGRVFDKDSRSHGVDRLLHLAASHPEIFAKEALRNRKLRLSPTSNDWLDEFMTTVHVPTQSDFKRLILQTQTHRKTYEQKYAYLRNKVYAHNDRMDLTGLNSQTSIREVERMLAFLLRLGNALWHLFNNGYEPTIGRSTIRTKLTITRETSKFLSFLIDRRTN